jgi:hypothetical protein
MYEMRQGGGVSDTDLLASSSTVSCCCSNIPMPSLSSSYRLSITHITIKAKNKKGKEREVVERVAGT